MYEFSAQDIEDIILGKRLSANVNDHSAWGVLDILREVAIRRVQTANPAFNSASLDNWILGTGYPALGSPPGYSVVDHAAPIGSTMSAIPSDELWLISVWAASICNADLQRKPDPNIFGTLIGSAMGTAVRTMAKGKPPPTVQQLAKSALPFGGALAPTWRTHLANVAHGRSGSVMMARLLQSVIEFSVWLFLHGGAQSFYKIILRVSPPAIHISSLYSLVTTLSGFMQSGPAVAINFLKDVGATQLMSKRYNLNAARDVWAAWASPKPDDHVIRLCGKLTRDVPIYASSGIFTPSKNIVSQFNNPPLGNFRGKHYGFVPNGAYKCVLRIIADVWEWAECRGTSPIEIDRILYLIGKQKETVNGVVVTAPWYQNTEKVIDAAILAGVPRMS